MSEDGELLARFVDDSDQAAFAELVARHINLVYSTALRRLGGDAHIAEDVAQTVFSTLAWKARRLPRTIVLAGWLHEATRFAAAKVIRTERRRQAREQEALLMQESTSDTVDWNQLSPILDTAIGELRAADRNAVLLRFFERKDLRAIGNALGTSEDAAQKRVGRALEKLRTILSRHGVAFSSAALAAVVMESAVQAAPAGLAQTVANVSLTGTATRVGFMPQFVETVLAAKAKFITGGIVAVSALTLLFVPSLVNAKRFHTVELTSYFNRLLASFNTTESWGLVPRGKVTFAGVPFQMVGKLDLTGLGRASDGEFQPPRIGEIPIGRRAARLHFIHGATYTSPDDEPVSEILLHYKNGETRRLFIVYGVHVRNWYLETGETNSALRDPQSIVAWTGVPGVASINPKVQSTRLFKTTFDNPLPVQEIRSVEFLSLFGLANSVIVAMTLEESANNNAPLLATEASDDAPYRRAMLVRVLDDTTGEPISNAVLKARVTDERRYSFGNYQSDTDGAARFVYPPGRFRALSFQASAAGYRASTASQTNDSGSFPDELIIRLGRTVVSSNAN